MTAKVGHDMKLYRNTGTVAIPVWTVIADIGDVNIPQLNMSLAELKRRSSDFVKNLAAIIQSIRVEFNFPHGLDATNFDALRANFFSRTAEEFYVADGDSATTGTQGLRLPAFVADFPWSQAQEEVSSHDVALAIAYMEESSTEVDPSWYIVS